MSEILTKIKSRGFWTVRIRPAEFQKDRIIKHRDLIDAVQKCSVEFRGWDFPHFDHKEPPIRTPEYVEQEIDWEHHVEFWRAYKSGQFVSISALWVDWRDQSGLWGANEDCTPGDVLSIEDTVFRLVEIYEYAARWARVANMGNQLVIECKLKGIKGRELMVGPNRADFLTPRAASIDEWEWKQKYPSAVLFSTPRKLAVNPALNLFELFGLDTNEDLIRDIQKELRS